MKNLARKTRQCIPSYWVSSQFKISLRKTKPELSLIMEMKMGLVNPSMMNRFMRSLISRGKLDQNLKRKAGTSEVSNEEEAVSEVSNEEAVPKVILEDHARFTCEQESDGVIGAAIDKQAQNVHQDQNVVASEQENETYNQPLPDDTPQAETGRENEWVTCENPFECPVQETKFDLQRKVALGNANDKWTYELPNRQPVQGVTHGGQDKVTPKYDNVASSELANKQLQSGVFEDKSVMLPVQRYEVENHGLYNKHPAQDTSLNQGKVLDHQNKQMSSEFPDRQIVQESFPEIQRKMAFSHGNERVQNEFSNKQPGQDAIFEYQRRIALGHGSNYQQSAEEVAQGVERTAAPTGYMFVKENSGVNIDSNRMTGSDYHRGHAFQCKVCKLTFYQEHQYNKHMETYHKEGNDIAHKATSDNLTNKSYGKLYNLTDGMACFPPGTSLGKPAYGDFPVKGDHFSFNTMVYKCKYCNVVFGNCEAFQWHLFHAHSKNSFYECYLCRTKYTDRGQFTNHIQSHTQREMHTCSFCKEGLHICEIGFYSEAYANKLRDGCVYNEQNYNLLYNHELRYPAERAGNVGNQHPNSSVVCNVVGETESSYNQKQYNYGRYNLENNAHENYANSNMSQIHKGSLKASEDLRQLNMFSPETSAQRIHENVINVMFEEFVKVEENCFYSGQENFGYERRLFSVVNHNFADNSHNPCGSGNIPVWTDNEMGNEEFTQVFDILYNTGQGSGGVIGKNDSEFNIPLKKKRKTTKSDRNGEGKKRGRGQSSKKVPQSTEGGGGPNPLESGDPSNENTTISYNARLYECNVCHRKFQHDCNLHLHMKVHESNPDEKEEDKEKEEEKEESPSESLLANVEELVEENGLYSCKICKKQYTSAAELKQHKASHWETRLFFCNICKKDFRQYANLVRHKEGVHERLKPHSCSVCNKSFHTVSQLNIHRNAVHEKIRSYQCDTCPMKFSCKFNMLRHREKVHEKIKLDLVPPAAEPSKKKAVRRRRRKGEKEGSSENQHVHSCEQHRNDGKDGTSEVCPEDHSKVAHEDEKGDTNEVQQTENSQGNSQNGSEVSNSGGSKCTCKKGIKEGKKRRRPRSKKVVVKPYSCDLCKQTFKTLRILKKHMMVLHETEGFPCNFCGKEYVSIVLLSKHERIHINKLYECSECSQKFHRKFLYDRHRKECCPNSIEIPDGEASNSDDFGKDGSNISSDTEETLEIEKNLSCNICSKKFAKSGSLQRHLLYAHPENKPFSCHICKREFAGKCHLILHKKSHTQRKSFDCVMCEKGIHICEEGFFPASHPKKCSESSRDQKVRVNMSLDHEGYGQGEKTTEKESQESNCSQGIVEVSDEASISSKKESLSEEGQLRQECFDKSPYVLLEKLKTDRATGKQQTSDGEMPFACNLCFKTFERAHTLKRHLLYAHPKVKPFTCEICKRDFVARCHLIVHAKKHSPKMPHDCEMCQRQMHICEKGFHIGKEDQTNSDPEGDCTSPYCQEHCIPSETKGKIENQDTADSKGPILCNKGTVQDNQLPVVTNKPDTNVFGCHEAVLGGTVVVKEEKECSDHSDLELQGEIHTVVDPNWCEMSCLECKRVFENNALYMQHLPCKGMVTKQEGGNQEIHQYYQDDLMKSEMGNKGICYNNPFAKLPKCESTLESSENHDNVMVTNSSERMDVPENRENKNLLKTGHREIHKSNENFVHGGRSKSNPIAAVPYDFSVKNLITTNEGTSSKHGLENKRPKCQAVLSESKSTAGKDYLEKSSKKDWKTDSTFKIYNHYKLAPGKRSENSLKVKLINKNVDQTTLNCANSSEDSFDNERNDAVTSADETQNNIGREQQKVPIYSVEKITDSKSKTSEKTPLASEGDCVKNIHLSTTGITENSGENSDSIQGSNHCQTSVPCEKNEGHLANKELVGRGDSTQYFERKVSCTISKRQVVDNWMKL
ncbi:uncharacterized protein LOC135203490 isoform X2 [Macrobrachium nipponense]|uniref:uncharacterized protein LOC135203490 isoform X2 n=1 Tax=Macrobrachium nipponense TaxID=159736 RepID=UPI0030C7C38A